MSQQQIQRIKVIENAVAGNITVREAAESLNLSERQVQRLKGCCDVKDGEWVQHGNRGRTPTNALEGEKRERIVQIRGRPDWSQRYPAIFLNDFEVFTPNSTLGLPSGFPMNFTSMLLSVSESIT